MPTFDAIRQDSDNRELVRKIQSAVAMLRLKIPGRSLPTTLFDAASNTNLVDLKAAGWWPVGLVTPDGYTFTREVSMEDVSAMGYASPIRSDPTAVPRTVSFTPFELLKRRVLELVKGASYAGVVPTATGEVVIDEPDLPADQEYELLVLGKDGPALMQWIIGKGYGAVKLSGTGDESWGGEGAASRQLTFNVFTDKTLGVPVREYIGGTAALANARALGFTIAVAWAATSAKVAGDRVTVTGGTLEAMSGGTTGATAPTNPTSVGGVVVDGTVTWQRIV